MQLSIFLSMFIRILKRVVIFYLLNNKSAVCVSSAMAYAIQINRLYHANTNLRRAFNRTFCNVLLLFLLSVSPFMVIVIIPYLSPSLAGEIVIKSSFIFLTLKVNLVFLLSVREHPTNTQHSRSGFFLSTIRRSTP